MSQKTIKFLTALFSLLISACVSQMPSQNFDRQQAAKARVELGFDSTKCSAGKAKFG